MTDPTDGLTESEAEQYRAAEAMLRDALLIGWNPYAEEHIRSVVQASFDVMDFMRQNSGLARTRSEALGLLMRDPNTRAVAEIASKFGLPMSEVRDRWSEEDITMELALTALHSIEKAEQCPDCGINPGEMFDENSRALAEPAYMVAWHSCPVCHDLAVLADEAKPDLAEGEDPPPYQGRYVLKPRQPGDDVRQIQQAHIDAGRKR